MNSEKEREAIERLQMFAPRNGDSYYLCYSGGKDSDAIRILAALAGVPHEIHHNLTTVDAPETMQYIKSVPGVIIDKARYADGTHKTMWNLIPRKGMPPTRLVRYCCAELKEVGGRGRMRVTGVRFDESAQRRKNGGIAKVIGKPKTTMRRLEEEGINFRLTQQGGVVFNAETGDNESLRDAADFLQTCYRDRSTTINPIVDWTERDVWEFLRHYGCEGNPLYQCGEKRVGCVGCPLSQPKRMRADLRRYPKYKAAYIRAFDRMLIARAESGKPNWENWKTGADVLRWWTMEDTDQYSMFTYEELEETMRDISEKYV